LSGGTGLSPQEKVLQYWPQVKCSTIFTTVINVIVYLATVFGIVSHFYPSHWFLVTGEIIPLRGCFSLILVVVPIYKPLSELEPYPQIIDQDNNALHYWFALLITAVKSFIVEAQDKN
jgi:hypothetical protein